MVDAPTWRLQPPLQDQPLGTDGKPSLGWTQYYQNLADRLTDLASHAGTVTNDDAGAGNIGEYKLASGSIGLTSLANANVITLALTAGDWDVCGNVRFTPAGTTHPFTLMCSVSAVSATVGLLRTQIQGTFPVGQENAFDAGGVTRFSLAAPATAYLIANAVFTTSTMTAFGVLTARRMR